MLITSPHQFGDKALNPEEGVAKFREENNAMLESRKLTKQAELEDEERSAGPRLAYQEITRRIHQCNPQLIVKDGTPGNVALYAMVVNEEGQREMQYVGGMPKEPLPEYSHVIVDERGLPKREFRGWRSVLIGLVKNRVLTYQDTVRQFGEALGQRSWRWHQALQGYKG
jgi:hypothetical protein